MAGSETVEGARATGHTGLSYQPGLDGLRAVAVGSVMAFHFGATWAGGGFLGVDTFFVLSGYLITSLLLVEWGRTGTLRFPAFWARRARRLLPALLVALIAVAIWSYLVARSDRLGSIRVDELWTLFYGANWHFIHSGQSYFDLFSEPSPLRHAWSLAIEEQFYLLWPVITFASLRIARGRPRVLAAVCVTGIAVSTFLLAHLYNASDPSRSYYGTDTRASQLLVGALLAILLLKWMPRARATRVALQVAGLLGAAVTVWAFAVASDRDSWLYHGGFLAFAIATAVVIAAIVQPVNTPLRAVLSLRPVRWIGQVSYGLYLWHWPVVVFLSEARTGLSGWNLALARLGVTLSATTLSYYLIELPIRRGVVIRARTWMARVAAPIAFAVTASLVLVATAGATPPPKFLAAPQNKVLKTHPAHRVQPNPSNASTPPMLLVGDSVAGSLADALQADAAKRGISLQAQTRPGCGLVTGVPALSDGTEVKWGRTCDEGTLSYLRSSTRDTGAKVVLWLSTWETADRLVNGHFYKFGTRAADRVLLTKFDESRRALTADGARIVILTIPPRAKSSDLIPHDIPNEDAQFLHLNKLFRTFAAQHPDTVTLIDFAHLVCPTGPPCPEFVDGVRLRPRDGGHFEGSGPGWVAPRLLDSVLRALAVTPPSATTPAVAHTSAQLTPAAAPGPPPRMLFLGDSVADTLDGALHATAAARGIPFDGASRPGCGMVTGIPAASNGVAISWGAACSDGTVRFLSDQVHSSNPQVVVWLSTWETADRIVDGRFYQFGTAPADHMLLAKLQESWRILTAGGARLVLVAIPPRAFPNQVVPADNPTEDAGYLHLDDLFRRFARWHPSSVRVADLNPIVCPSGPPCPMVVDGVVLRPHDGGHYSNDGANWTAPRLLDAIMAALQPAPERVPTFR